MQGRSVLADVVRPAIAWPLRSWPRLVSVILGVVVALWLVGRIDGGDKQGPPAAATSSTSPATATTSSTSPATATTSSTSPGTVTTSSTSPATGSDVNMPGDVQKAAQRFMDAWLKTDGVKPDQWRKGLDPYVTDDLKKGFASTDPGRVDAQRIAGPIVDDPTQGNTGSRYALIAPTDGGDMRLVVVREKGKWLVSSIEPVPTINQPQTS